MTTPVFVLGVIWVLCGSVAMYIPYAKKVAEKKISEKRYIRISNERLRELEEMCDFCDKECGFSGGVTMQAVLKKYKNILNKNAFSKEDIRVIVAKVASELNSELM